MRLLNNRDIANYTPDNAAVERVMNLALQNFDKGIADETIPDGLLTMQYSWLFSFDIHCCTKQFAKA